MLADLKAGRESYREELREEFGSKCKAQEDRFMEKKRKLEAERRSLEQNLHRVRRECSDEKSARRRAVEEVKRLREELDSLRAQIAPVAEQAAERRATAAHACELSHQFLGPVQAHGLERLGPLQPIPDPGADHHHSCSTK